MTALPTLKLRVAVNFPSQVLGTGGIKIVKANGIFTISPDFPSLSILAPTSLTDPTSKQVWIFDPVTGVYNVMTLSGLGDALYKLTSTTSNTIGTGSKTFTVQSGKDITVGDFILVTDDGAPSTNFMSGQVTAYSTTSLTVNVTSTGGSGTKTAWTLRISGPIGLTGTTGATGAVGLTTPQGRLTLTTGTAVMVSDVAAATTVYYTAAQFVPLYNGSSLVMTATGGELSQATTDATKSPAAVANNSNYDKFAWEDSATVTITIASPAVVSYTSHGLLAGMPVKFTTSGALPTGITAGQFYYVIAAGLTANAFEFSATVGGSAVNTSGSQSGTQTLTVERVTRGPTWNAGAVAGSDTARGTGAGSTELDFTTAPGFALNKNAITNGPAALRGTYVGTVRSNGAAAIDMKFGTSAAGGGMATLGVYNAYNQVNLAAKVQDSTATWNYTSTTIRSTNNSATNRVNFVVGLTGTIVRARLLTWVNMVAAANAFVDVGLGLDTTTTFLDTQSRAMNSTGATAVIQPTYTYSGLLGFHFVQALEKGDGTNANQFAGGSPQNLFLDMWM